MPSSPPRTSSHGTFGRKLALRECLIQHQKPSACRSQMPRTHPQLAAALEFRTLPVDAAGLALCSSRSASRWRNTGECTRRKGSFAQKHKKRKTPKVSAYCELSRLIYSSVCPLVLWPPARRKIFGGELIACCLSVADRVAERAGTRIKTRAPPVASALSFRRLNPPDSTVTPRLSIGSSGRSRPVINTRRCYLLDTAASSCRPHARPWPLRDRPPKPISRERPPKKTE